MADEEFERGMWKADCCQAALTDCFHLCIFGSLYFVVRVQSDCKFFGFEKAGIADRSPCVLICGVVMGFAQRPHT